MTLIEQLTRLAEQAPAVCWQTDRGAWGIGDIYTFVINPDSGQLSAYCEHTGNRWITGRPALAWLEDALRQVIEARGWQWSLNRISDEKSIAEVKAILYTRASEKTPIEALLAALLKALEDKG